MFSTFNPIKSVCLHGLLFPEPLRWFQYAEVLVGSWCCTVITADLHSDPSHFVTQGHVQSLSSHRIYKTCRVSPRRFRPNAVAVISSVLCPGLFWQLIVRCDSRWSQRRLQHSYSTSLFALFWSFMTVLVALYQC